MAVFVVRRMPVTQTTDYKRKCGIYVADVWKTTLSARRSLRTKPASAGHGVCGSGGRIMEGCCLRVVYASRDRTCKRFLMPPVFDRLSTRRASQRIQVMLLIWMLLACIGAGRLHQPDRACPANAQFPGYLLPRVPIGSEHLDLTTRGLDCSGAAYDGFTHGTPAR